MLLLVKTQLRLDGVSCSYSILCLQVTLETTIGNSNPALWKFVQPKGTVFEWLRNIVANRLAATGEEWADIFSKYNSGTWVLHTRKTFNRRYHYFVLMSSPRAGSDLFSAAFCSVFKIPFDKFRRDLVWPQAVLWMSVKEAEKGHWRYNQESHEKSLGSHSCKVFVS